MLREVTDKFFLDLLKNATYNTSRNIKIKKYWAGRQRAANGLANSIYKYIRALYLSKN
jgi:hypothetical protein